jgi:hypothetical protein
MQAKKVRSKREDARRGRRAGIGAGFPVMARTYSA